MLLCWFSQENPEVLNQILRSRYHGTDITSTASEIARQKVRTVHNDGSGTGRGFLKTIFGQGAGEPVPLEPASQPTISAGFQLSPRPMPQFSMPVSIYSTPSFTGSPQPMHLAHLPSLHGSPAPSDFSARGPMPLMISPNISRAPSVVSPR